MATLIGGGGHANDIYNVLSSLIERRVDHHKELDEGPWWSDAVIIGINDPQLRAQVAKEIGVEDWTWIHPKAYLGVDVTMGYGCHLNYLSSMTRTTLGNHVNIGPGVTIGGDVHIGDRVNVCMGSIIGVRHPGETVTIGDDATIGAGSVVLHDIPAGETWVGNPARRLR